MAECITVISQPMFIPWIGLFEQIGLATHYVHYDDVQLPQGRSFVSRVQLKTAQGVIWLTAPVDHKRSGRTIRETVLCPPCSWRPRHLKTIRQSLANAPYAKVAIDLAEAIYAAQTDDLAEFNVSAIECISQWLGLVPTFSVSSSTGVFGSSSQRLLDICKHFSSTRYVTGHGAFQYLDHELFEASGVSVHYMRYRRQHYNQQHGEFTPHVSVLDAIACCGSDVRALMTSDTVDWRMHVPSV